MTDRDRLIELIDGFVFGTQIAVNSVEWDSTKVKELADYLLANGVIVPPCKAGDTVYCIENKTIHECIVKLVKSLTYESQTVFFVEAECEIVDPFYSDGRKRKHGVYAVWEIEWGSHYRAFLTKEEAEAKLKELKCSE